MSSTDTRSPTYEELRLTAVRFNSFILQERADHGMRNAPWVPEDDWMLDVTDCRTDEEKAHDRTIK